MDFIELKEFIEFTLEKKQEGYYKQQYNNLLPFMYLKMLKYVSFNDFYEKSTGKNLDLRPAEVIIEEIMAKHKGVK